MKNIATAFSVMIIFQSVLTANALKPVPNEAMTKLTKAKSILAKNKALNEYLAIPLFRRSLPEYAKTNERFKRFIIQETKAVMSGRMQAKADASILEDYKIALLSNLAMFAHDGSPEAGKVVEKLKKNKFASEIFKYTEEFLKKRDERERLRKAMREKSEREYERREAEIKRMKEEPLETFYDKLMKLLADTPFKYDDNETKILSAAMGRESEGFAGLSKKMRKNLENSIIAALDGLKASDTKRNESRKRWERGRKLDRARVLINIYCNLEPMSHYRLFLKKLIRGKFPKVVKEAAMEQAKMIFGRN
ncbi:MAG: hypothetical protein GXP32_08860 [Kiritimatiellaeota bacterium]|nr:hypothetical protein [Kiritimatiellota bacterium]